jgi:putative transposase
LSPALLRGLASSAIENYRVSVRRACSLIMISTSVWYYRPNKQRDESLLRKRMREIAEVRVRYGFWRIFTLLRREGFIDNHKRVHRLYCNEGLNLRSRRPRGSRSSAHRLDRIELLGINQSWVCTRRSTSFQIISDSVSWWKLANHEQIF